jgi:hypothetical protein
MVRYMTYLSNLMVLYCRVPRSLFLFVEVLFGVPLWYFDSIRHYLVLYSIVCSSCLVVFVFHTILVSMDFLCSYWLIEFSPYSFIFNLSFICLCMHRPEFYQAGIWLLKLLVTLYTRASLYSSSGFMSLLLLFII